MSGSVCERHCPTVHERQASLNPTQKIDDFGVILKNGREMTHSSFGMALNECRGLHCLSKKGKQRCQLSGKKVSAAACQHREHLVTALQCQYVTNC